MTPPEPSRARLALSQYDACMPKGPLIEDRQKRQIVIAVAMGALLALSLGAALLFTGASLGF